MKKLSSLIIMLALAFGLKAQTYQTHATDFTVTDCHGKEYHLYELLDKGQYVLIDLFFTTCYTCTEVMPSMVEAYSRLGCNQGEVFFMEISDVDDDATLNTWCNRYGVEYPTIGKNGGGVPIVQYYNPSGYPTIILIAPDRSVVIRDLWPVMPSQNVVNALADYGIEEHTCTDGMAEEDVLDLRFYPNPASASVTLSGGNLGLVGIYNAMGQKMEEIMVEGTEASISTAHYPNGLYFVKTGQGLTQRFLIVH